MKNLLKSDRAHLPIYLICGVLLFSFVLHIVFLIKHPGSTYVQIPPEVLEQQVAEGTMTEATAKLKEHTWMWGSRDAYLYSKQANQLIEHGIYGYDTYNTDEIIKNAFVTPGWPLLLVALFSVGDLLNVEQINMVRIANMLFTLGTIFLLYVNANKIFHNRWVGVVASALYATYFTPYHYFRSALTEIPGIFFYSLALFLFLKALETNRIVHHLFFAIVFCYGVMIRPTTAPLVLIGFVIIIWKNRENFKEWMKIGVVWAIGAILVISPWVIRNYIAFDELVLFSTHSGNSWYNGANPYQIYSFSDYWREREALGIDSKEYAFKKIREGFDQDPNLWFSWFTVGKTYELFKLPDAIYFYKGDWIKLVKLHHNFIVIVALLVAVISRKRKVMAVSALLVGYIVLSNLFLTIPRYGFYIVPIMCLLVGYGVIRTIEWFRWKLPPGKIPQGPDPR